MNLNDAPAPADVSPGWKTDPLGANEWRWWDGASWSERVGTSHKTVSRIAVPAAGGGAAYSPSIRLCPHCGGQSQSAAIKCPDCGKSYKKRTALKIIVGITVLGLVCIAGCAALLVSEFDNAIDELNEEQQKHAISRAQFKALEIGMTEQQVRNSVGKTPTDLDGFEADGFLDEGPETSCIYYNMNRGDFLDSYQLCFTNGKLTSKSEY